MADYTPQQAAEILRLIPGAVATAIEVEQPLANMDLKGDILQRAHDKGLRNDGSPIGQYDTKPIYVSIEGARAKYGSQIPTSKLQPRGVKAKGKKAQFRVVNEDGEQVAVQRKSMYFPDGYKGFRGFMGRAVDKVNLKLTGQMSGSVEAGTNANVSTIAFTNALAAKKLAGNEERFTGDTGTIYRPSVDELSVLRERLKAAAERAINELLPPK